MEPKNIIYNNQEYIYIDKLSVDTTTFYLFATEEDLIYCTLENGQFVPISNDITEKLNLIFGLNETDVFGNIMQISLQDLLMIYSIEIPLMLKYVQFRKSKNFDKRSLKFPELSDEIIDLTIERMMTGLESLKQNGLDIELSEIRKRLSDGKNYIINDNSNYEGFFRRNNNAIYVKNSVIETKDIDHISEIISHEMIHRSGKNGIIYKTPHKLNGLLEGQVEDLNKVINSKKASSIIPYKDEQIEKQLLFNFPKDTSYPYQVSLVRQMQHILGKNSYNSILEGNKEFENAFKQKYGIALFIQMKVRASLTTSTIYLKLLNKYHNEINQINKDNVSKKDQDKINNIINKINNIYNFAMSFFEKSQNYLMENAFKQDFSNVQSLEDIQTFLTKLQTFETTRGQLYYKTKEDTEPKKDTYFENFYNQYYEMSKSKLKELGYSEDEIKQLLEDYKYQEQEYYPFMGSKDNKKAEKEYLDAIQSFLSFRYGKSITLNDIDIYKIQLPKSKANAILVFKDNKYLFYMPPSIPFMYHEELQDLENRYNHIIKPENDKSTILQGFSKYYNIKEIEKEKILNNENESENIQIIKKKIPTRRLTPMQKLAKTLKSSNHMMKLSYIKRFVEKQLNRLPEKTGPVNDHNQDERKEFLNDLSNNGEYQNIDNKNISNKKELNQEEKPKKDTEIGDRG